MEGNELGIYMDAPVCVRATRTGRQDEHGCFRSLPGNEGKRPSGPFLLGALQSSFYCGST